jgi:ABC-type transport system involved in multi-copper enzyme maturation permease subunit
MDREQYFVLSAFVLIGVVVGYLTFLIFRISVQQQKFDWAGALSVVTSLAGGGFLSYWSQPRNFAAYGIGFFAGFAAYWRFLQLPGIQRGSQFAPSTRADEVWRSEESELDSDSYPSRASDPVRLPEDPNDLIRTISDVTTPAAHRVKALLALRTQRHSEDILVTDSLREDLDLADFDLFVLPALLHIPLPSQAQPVELNVVGDLVSFVAGQR